MPPPPDPPSALRVVFFGTPVFALPALSATLAAPAIEPVLVVTQPDRPAGRGRRLTPSPVKVLAEERGLPVFQPERLRGAEVLERLRSAAAGLFVIAAYGQILRAAVLDLPRFGCLNVHPSLLPRHRGPAPIAAAILAGDAETGVTIMLTDRGLDTGPILTQRRVPLGRAWTAASLEPHLASIGADLLIETIPRWVRGEIVPRAQDDALATTSRLFTTADGAIDWARPALELERQVRALNPWPRAYTFDRGKRLQILTATAIEGEVAAEPAPDLATAAPGTILAERGTGRMVATTGRGLLALDEIQAEGRRATDSATYLRGNPTIRGARLSASVESEE